LQRHCHLKIIHSLYTIIHRLYMGGFFIGGGGGC
jgi:hypothetical protein